MVMVHWDYPPTKNCKHPEWTYGELCVKCGECGRYNKNFTCVNCGKRVRNKPPDQVGEWGSIEFIDVFSAPICPDCRSLFKKEDRINFKDTWDYVCNGSGMDCYKKDFIKRVT